MVFDNMNMKNRFLDLWSLELVLTIFVNTTNVFAHDEFWIKTKIIINEIYLNKLKLVKLKIIDLDVC